MPVRSRHGDNGRDERKFLEALHFFTVHNITWRGRCRLSAALGTAFDSTVIRTHVSAAGAKEVLLEVPMSIPAPLSQTGL